jgi:hypothetical protein
VQAGMAKSENARCKNGCKLSVSYVQPPLPPPSGWGYVSQIPSTIQYVYR